MIRLHKFLAEAGIASRRKAEELIKKGKVTVNGSVVQELGTLVDPEKDKVEYSGKPVKPSQEKIYIALNKPLGYISSASGAEGKSVLQLVDVKQRIYPVGRLDKDSTGLMILTNDGELTNKITHPRYGSEKEYFVVLDAGLKEDHIKKLERGLKINGQKLQGIKVVSAQNKSARLILKEGINRQIRKMMGFLGYKVIKLKRIRIGKLELGDLKEGQWKKISKKDI